MNSIKNNIPISQILSQKNLIFHDLSSHLLATMHTTESWQQFLMLTIDTKSAFIKCHRINAENNNRWHKGNLMKKLLMIALCIGLLGTSICTWCTCIEPVMLNPNSKEPTLIGKQSNGKIIKARVCGCSFYATRFAVTKSLLDVIKDAIGYTTKKESLDTEFGTNGSVTTDMSCSIFTTCFGKYSSAAAIILPDDSIVIAGKTGCNIAVAKYNSNGILIKTDFVRENTMQERAENLSFESPFLDLVRHEEEAPTFSDIEQAKVFLNTLFSVDEGEQKNCIR